LERRQGERGIVKDLEQAPSRQPSRPRAGQEKKAVEPTKPVARKPAEPAKEKRRLVELDKKYYEHFNVAKKPAGKTQIYDDLLSGKKVPPSKVEAYLKDGGKLPAKAAKSYPFLSKKYAEQIESEVSPTTLGAGPFASEPYKALGKTVTTGMRKISEMTTEMVKKAQEKPEIKRGVVEAKETMIEHDRQIRRSESTSKLLKKTVKDIVKEPDRQMLMVHAYEHKMRGPHWNKLGEIEKGVVRWAAEEKAKLNKFIKDNEVLEMMPPSDKINHIFHHWINPKSGKPYEAMYGKFSKGLPQAKQRVIPTYETGIAKGLKPATTNLGELIGLEWEAAMRAHQTRQMFKSLAKIEGEKGITIKRMPFGKDKPIRLVERWDLLNKQGLAEDYVRATDMGPSTRNALTKRMKIKVEDGSTISIGMDVGVHKNLAPFVRAYIENPTYKSLMQLNFISKSLKLGGNLFHPVMLGWQELANWRIPFKNIPRGLKLRKELGWEIRLLHQEGLPLFKGYEDVGYRNQFFEGVNFAGKAGNVITKPVTLMRDFIFEIVQPGMKTAFAFDKFGKLLPEYLKGTEWTPEMVKAAFESGKSLPKEVLECARAVVKKSDGHFSGEHYKRSLLETNRWMVKMYFSPEARKFWQAALLSPTWQREHLLVGKDVSKSFVPNSWLRKAHLKEMGPIRYEYQKYALGGICIIGAVDMWNYMMTQEMDGKGKHLWQNPTGKGFAVRAWWDEPGYSVTDKNGRKRKVQGGPTYIRPLKSLFEIAEWGGKPFRKFGYKVSPMVSAIGRMIFPSKYQKEYGSALDIPEATLNFVTDVGTPITADQFIDWVKGKKSFKAAALPFIGMPVSKVKEPKTKRKRRLPKYERR